MFWPLLENDSPLVQVLEPGVGVRPHAAAIQREDAADERPRDAEAPQIVAAARGQANIHEQRRPPRIRDPGAGESKDADLGQRADVAEAGDDAGRLREARVDAGRVEDRRRPRNLQADHRDDDGDVHVVGDADGGGEIDGTLGDRVVAGRGEPARLDRCERQRRQREVADLVERGRAEIRADADLTLARRQRALGERRTERGGRPRQQAGGRIQLEYEPTRGCGERLGRNFKSGRDRHRFPDARGGAIRHLRQHLLSGQAGDGRDFLGKGGARERQDGDRYRQVTNHNPTYRHRTPSA